MKKLSINISLFFVLLTLSSCNDWLDEVKQTTTVSDEIIWQDETQVDKYVNRSIRGGPILRKFYRKSD